MHGDRYVRALRPFQQIGNFRRRQTVSRFAVHFQNHVGGFQSRSKRRRPHHRRKHFSFILVHAVGRDGHADAVIFAALIFAQQRIGLGVEKCGMRVKHPQHAGNRAFVERLVGVHRHGVILLHHRQDVGELAYGVLQLIGARCRGAHCGAIDPAEDGGNDQHTKNEHRPTTFSAQWQPSA